MKVEDESAYEIAERIRIEVVDPSISNAECRATMASRYWLRFLAPEPEQAHVCGTGTLAADFRQKGVE